VKSKYILSETNNKNRRNIFRFWSLIAILMYMCLYVYML